MLDLTSKPSTSTAALTAAKAVKMPKGPTLADLRAHVEKRKDLATSTREKWLRVIDRVARILNRPLDQIDAELELVEVRFPPEWTDAAEWPTARAYRSFRGPLQGALREFLGVHAIRAELAAREDDWAALIAAVEPLTKGKLGAVKTEPYWHPMKLVGLKTLAREARFLGIQPGQLNVETGNQVASAVSGNLRRAVISALRRLDELYAFPEPRHLLPAQPIAFTPERLVPTLVPLPEIWETQIIAWVTAVTVTNWDPVAEKFSDDHDKHAHVLRSALRTCARIALDLGLVAPDGDLHAVLANDTTMIAIAREMFESSGKSKKEGGLAPRSSRKYLKGWNQVRAHLGIDLEIMQAVLANNEVSRKGAKNDKEMTQKNRQFCEALLEKPALRRRFFMSHRAIQAEAMRILDLARSEGRDLTGNERADVRMLGVAACFAAIEIGGAPIRMKNAIQLTWVGEDAKIRIPEKGTKPIAIFIPGGETKNKKPIEVRIKPCKHGYYDVIRWFIKDIRPHFPNAKTSPYLFPSLKHPDGHVSNGHFRDTFKSLMANIADVPMTPHQMRHGQTSLLLNAHPDKVEVIAMRIGDHPDTLRQFYGWLNALRLVERGQDLLAGLIDG